MAYTPPDRPARRYEPAATRGIAGWPQAIDAPTDARAIRSDALQRAVLAAAAGVIHGGAPPATAAARVRHLIVARLQNELLARIDAQDLVGCDHLRDGDPAWWMHAIPRAFLCDQCVTTAHRPWCCDACTQPAPLQLTRHTLQRGPTTLLAFLCPRCTHAMDAAESTGADG